MRLPIQSLVPDAVFTVPGVPDWLCVDACVWVSNEPRNSVSRLDPRTNHVAATVTVGRAPGSGLAAGFGSLWVPNCGDGTISRVDLSTNAVTAVIPCRIADSEGGVAIGAGSLWVMIDTEGTLARIDPTTNAIVARIRVAPGSFAVAFGAGSAWITSTVASVLTRVDPATNHVVATVPVGPNPRFLAVDEGCSWRNSVWTLNQGDGSITRVDAITNQVIATIEAGIPGNGGEIASGEGSVWATVFGTPLTRIDPSTNRVAQQFVGPGGDAVRVGHGSVWLSNLRLQNVWRLDPRRIEATR